MDDGATIIVFQPSVRKFLRFDAPSFAECARAMFAERDSRDVRDFQEVIRGTTWHRLVIDVDKDWSADTAQSLDVRARWFRNMIEEVAQVAIDVYLDLFRDIIAPKDIIACESIDSREPGRMGAHIIIARAVPHFKVSLRFADALIAALPEEYRACIDRAIYSSQHNLRVIGCTKVGSQRVKKLADARANEIDTLVSAPALRVPQDAIDRMSANARECARERDLDDPDVSRACILVNEKYGSGVHTFRRAYGSLVTFQRMKPSHCDICARAHDHDNTVLVAIDEDRRANVVRFRELCRRAGRARSVVLAEVARENCVTETIRESERESDLRTRDELIAKCSRVEVYAENGMRPYPLARTLFVRAPMKIGKTKELRRFVTQYIGDREDARVVILSFRRTFTRAIARAFSEFTLYSDLRGEITDTRRLIVQVESLHRIAPDLFGTVDLLIMDESESILGQFDSGLSAHRANDFAVFQWLARYSRVCVALDAYMTDRTLAVIGRARGWEDSVFVRNQYQNSRDMQYYLTGGTGRDIWLLSLAEYVARGKRVVVCANSVTEGRTLRELIEQRLGERACVKFYCAETPANTKARDFASVDNAWVACDVLIYTPTLTAGVSFERDHFDAMFGYFTDCSCDAQTCIQMMGRIRNVGDRRVFVYINSSRGCLPATREDIILALRIRKGAVLAESIDIGVEFDARGLPTVPDTDYAELRVRNIIARNRSRNNFAREFIAMIKETGARIRELNSREFCSVFERESFPASELIATSIAHDNARDSVSLERASAISRARELTGEEYELINEKLQRVNRSAFDTAERAQEDVPCEDDIFAAQKFVLRAVYERHTEELSSEFVLTFIPQYVARAFRNLREICGALRENNGDYVGALRDLRGLDRARMSVSLIPLDRRASERECECNGELDGGYMYEVHRLIHVLVTVGLGFTGILDKRLLARNDVEARAETFAHARRSLFWRSFLSHFKLPRGCASRASREVRIENAQQVIECVRQALADTYMMNLVLIGREMYKIELTDAFRVSSSFDLRAVVPNQ